MIQLQSITKTFTNGGRQFNAVDDVTLTINDGEVYGIIGFSGAGKSTLVRCINLLERPTSGKVILDGVDLTSLHDKKLREQRKKIGMIFQHFNFNIMKHLGMWSGEVKPVREPMTSVGREVGFVNSGAAGVFVPIVPSAKR